MFDADKCGVHRWPLVSLKAHTEAEVVLLGRKFLPLTVHWSRRSLLCCRDRCPLCVWLPTRGLYYLAVMCNGRVSMIELGSLSSGMLDYNCGLLGGGMRPGLVVRLHRSSRKSPVMSEVMAEKGDVREVGCEELAPRVMALYQMPGPNPDEAFDVWQTRLQVIARRRAELEVARLAAEAEKGVSGRR